ncbi:hypothetical protein U3516DRAFT_493272, partial [Neocallimastix sp. 'constans']
IIFTLYFYKNKTPKTNSTLHQQIDNNKYKFRINLNEFQFNRCDKSYYLFNVCKIENESINFVKFLIEHGENINREDKNNYTLLLNACYCVNKNSFNKRFSRTLGIYINKNVCFGQTP